MDIIQVDSNGKSKNINTSGIKEKIFKYCEKCCKELPGGSTSAFCDFYCKQEFFRENARELESCYREFIGRC